MQASHHRFFVSGQKAARAAQSNDFTKENQEKLWFQTALSVEQTANRKAAQEAFNKGFSAPRQIQSGMYL